MIRCPYHLGLINPASKSGEVNPYTCPESNCNQSIPRDYVEKTSIPRANIGLVGFTGHGKSVYITSLFYLLEFVMKNQWNNFYFLTCDDYTHRVFFKDVPRFKDSYLPDATPVHFPQPALIHFYHIPYFGEWFLSFYDTAGEVFEETARVTEQGRFVAYSDVVFFIISIKDSGRDWTRRVEELLHIYIRAVYDHMGVDLKKSQDLILVFTKGDDLLNPGFFDGFRDDIVVRGVWKDYLDPEKKISELRSLSRRVKRWLKEKGGKGILNICNDHFRSVEYTIVSATGAAPHGNRLASKLKPEDPKRVLDPFLWTLEKIRPRSLWERIFRRR